MGIASGHDSNADRRIRRIAHPIVIVTGLMAVAVIVGVTMAGLLAPTAEVIISAPFRW